MKRPNQVILHTRARVQCKGLRSSRRQGVLLEDDFLVKTLGNIETNPEVALTELVANARDAGASRWGALHIRAVLSLADGSLPDCGKGREKIPNLQRHPQRQRLDMRFAD